MIKRMRASWGRWADKHPETARFLTFFILSNGVTVLQLILMPLLKAYFDTTSLVDTSVQALGPFGEVGGEPYYIFDYPAGAIDDGGGGGLAYFLAVEIAILVAQVINFFAQRNITFKSNTNIWVAAFWYTIAFLAITLLAGAAQGFYKQPIYDWLSGMWGNAGITVADFVTMIINAAISFWVFYPIFKVIFKQKPEEEGAIDEKAAEEIEEASGRGAE